MNSLDAVDPGDLFLQRVRNAAKTVLAGSVAGRDVLRLCDDAARAREMILQDRASGATVIAIVGAAGQGKSWLARQLVKRPEVREAIPSGNAASEATDRMVWIGPSPPADLDPRRERYLHCEADAMLSLGGEYALVDTPGATDDDKVIAETARRALSLASVLVMVVRSDQLRSQTVGVLTALGEGTLVVPVINAIRNLDSPELATDIDALVGRMRAAAPSGTILTPITVPDFDMSGQDEAAIGRQVGEALASSLRSHLESRLSDERRRRIRLDAVDARFRESLRATLSAHLPELTRAVESLNAEAEKLPRDVARSLVGGSHTLRAGIRSRLRLSLLTNTAAIWFPFRSLLGLLNLTHGAWDRVLLSLSGSLPSLITAAWTSAQNWSRSGEAERDMRDGLRRRSAAAVADRLGPSIDRFHRQLHRLGNRSGDSLELTNDAHPSPTQAAYLAGIDALQEESQKIFDEEIERPSVSRWSAFFLGLIGTALFWTLMAGPFVALYRGYLFASYETIMHQGELTAFPRPEAAMLLTSLLLSILPTAIFAMLVLTWAQRNGRVLQAEERIRRRHDDAITRLQENRILCLRWTNPEFADAEFLLGAGSRGAPSESERRDVQHESA